VAPRRWLTSAGSGGRPILGRLGLPIDPNGPGGSKPPARARKEVGGPPPLAPGLPWILEELARDGFLHFAIRNRRLFRKFEELASSLFGGRVEACGLRFGTLFVRADSPHLLERCLYLKKEWIKSLNAEMGEDTVSDIVFRVLQPGQSFQELAGPDDRGDR
jgi:hypothetical protein